MIALALVVALAAQDPAPPPVVPLDEAPPPTTSPEAAPPPQEAPAPPPDDAPPPVVELAPRKPPPPAPAPAPVPPPDPPANDDWLVTFAAAYGAGLGVNAVYYAAFAATQIVDTLGVTGGPRTAEALDPVANVLGAVNLGLCVLLPAAQGAAVTATGDAVSGRPPGMAYLWTILASYGSCWGGGCVASLAQAGVVLAVLGPAILEAAQGQRPGDPPVVVTPRPDQQIVITAAALGIFGAFAVLQPLVPAGVYLLTRSDVDDPPPPAVALQVRDAALRLAGPLPVVVPAPLARAMPY